MDVSEEQSDIKHQYISWNRPLDKQYFLFKTLCTCF